jgi:hypothetical protein
MSISLTDALANLSGDIQIKDRLYTADGGVATKYTNATGAASVKGTIVKLGSTDDTVIINPADDPMPMGIVYEAGVANGSEMWVTIAEDAYVLLEDGTAGTAGYWLKQSDTAAGRADASNAAPTGGTIAALNDHFSEIGHCEETVSSGTDVLCKIHIHWN